MFVKLRINQQASRTQGQDPAAKDRWYDIPVSDIPPEVRKILMPHYRYSVGMFFYEEYRFPLEITHPVTNEKVVAALEECAVRAEEVISAYQSFSKFKRGLLLFRSIVCDYIDIVCTGCPSKKPVVENAARAPKWNPLSPVENGTGMDGLTPEEG